MILVDPETEYLRVKACYGLSATFQKQFKRGFGVKKIGQVLMEGTPFSLNASEMDSADYEDVKLENDFSSVMCVPLAAGEKICGYLHCDRKDDAPFTQDEFSFFEALGGLASFAIEKDFLLEENKNLTIIDKETNTYRLQAFLDRLSREMVCAAYRKTPISLGLIDLDNYKEFRKVFGTQKSKRLLSDIADLIRKNIKKMDLVGRYGTDELIVALLDLGKDKVTQVFDRIRQQVEAVGKQHTSPHTTVSIGALTLEVDDLNEEPSEIIKSLSKALYRAQVKGKNRVFVLEQE